MFRRWAEEFRQWRAYRAAMSRMRQMELQDPEVQIHATKPADLDWVGQSDQACGLLERACQRYSDRPCIATRREGEDYQAITYGQLWDQVLSLADGLSRGGWVKQGDLVGLCGVASVPWVVADLACLCLGAATVPLDAQISPEDFSHILAETGLSCLICQADSLLALAPALADQLALKSVLVIENMPDVQPLVGDKRWEQLERVFTGGSFRPVASDADQVFSIVYTSGSTGPPKGVALSHRRWTSTLKDSLQRDAVARLTLNYLPLGHMAGRINLYTTVMGGGRISMVCQPDMSTLLDDLAKARPTHMLLVPRVSGMIYQLFQDEMMSLDRLSRPDQRLTDPAAAEVCQRLKIQTLGGRLCFVHTGAAPTPPEVSAFLRQGLGLHVTDLYGSTEMGPLMMNGRVHDYVDYRLVDRPELGFTRADRPFPRGELAIRSPRASTGYYNNPQATESQLHDGYLLTGDIVEERAPRRLVWLDRRHNVLRLAQGEFVNVSRLEEVYQSESPYIDQIFLYGSPWQSYLLAVVVLSQSGAQNEDPQALVRQEFGRIGAHAGLKSHEIPRDFLLESDPFTVANGLLSPANKPRRPKLKEAYGPRLEALYEKLQKRQQSHLAAANLSQAERLRGALGLALGLDSVDPSRYSFLDLGGDSLSALRMTTLLRDHCQVEVSVADLLDPTVTLTGLLERASSSSGQPTFEKVHGADAAWANAADLSAMLEDKPADTKSAPYLGGEPQTVLLTGATGFLGRFLMLSLLERLAPRGGRLLVLVRAQDQQAARERLLEGYVTPQAREAFHRAEDRLEIVLGDLLRPRLGLSAHDFERLGQQVQSIVHAGALVNHALDYSHLFASNVAATAQLITLAYHTGPGKALHFVSTIGLAAGLQRRDPMREGETAERLWPKRPVQDQAGAYAQGYVTSKWAAEVLLQQAHRSTGCPLTVSRCGLILPHSRWPQEANSQDMLVRLLYGMRATGLAPSSMGSHTIDGWPVDLMANFLATLATEPCRGPATYHVTMPSRLGLDAIVAEASQRWGCQKLERSQFWPRFREALTALPADQQRLSPLAILHGWDRPGSGPLRVDTTAFQSKLSEMGPDRSLTAMDEEYWRRYLFHPVGAP